MVKYTVSLPPNPIKPWHDASKFIYGSQREYYASAAVVGQCHHWDGPFVSWSGAQTQSKEGSSPPFCPPQNLDVRSSLLLQISRSEASSPPGGEGYPSLWTVEIFFLDFQEMDGIAISPHSATSCLSDGGASSAPATPKSQAGSITGSVGPTYSSGNNSRRTMRLSQYSGARLYRPRM